MNKKFKKSLSQAAVLALTLIVNVAGNAGHGYYNHGGGGYYHGGGGYYHGGGYFGGGWGGPGVVIDVPFGGFYGPGYAGPGYVVPECEVVTVQICNQYNRCWLEKHCE